MKMLSQASFRFFLYSKVNFIILQYTKKWKRLKNASCQGQYFWILKGIDVILLCK